MDACRFRRGVLLAAGIVWLVSCEEAPAGPKSGIVTEDTPPGDSPPDLFGLAGAGMPFADAEIFFEFNSTDNDLGVQIFLDTDDGWKKTQARNSAGHLIFDFNASGPLRTLGITELRFESSEPSPAEVLALFSAGDYDFRAVTVDDLTLKSTASLSTALPPAPVFTPEDGDVVDPDNTIIQWDKIPGLEGYEIIVENEDTELSLSAEVGPSVTSLRIPRQFMDPGSDYKVEILAISTNGNKTIAEHAFSTQ